MIDVITHNIENELSNPNKKISRILDLLEKFFRGCGVERASITGGFVRDYVYLRRWDRIDHLMSGGKDIDIALNPNDFGRFHYFINTDYIRKKFAFEIVYQDSSNYILKFERVVDYPVNVDVFCGSSDGFNFTFNSIDIDLYSRKFDKDRYENIVDFIERKRIRLNDRLLSWEKTSKDFRGAEVLHFVYFCKKYRFIIDEVFINQLRILDALINVGERNAFYTKILPHFYKNKNFSTVLPLAKFFCQQFGLKNQGIIVDRVASFAENKVEKKAEVLDNRKGATFDFAKQMVPDIDIFNICHTEDYEHSIYFYACLRDVDVQSFLEVGYWIHGEWKTDKVDFDPSKDSLKLMVEEQYFTIVINNGYSRKYPNSFMDQKTVYFLNYDAKKSDSYGVGYEIHHFS